MYALEEQSRINIFKAEWERIENVDTYPHYLRDIITMKAEDFVEKVMNASEDEILELVNSVYSGDAYILKGAYSPSEVDSMKKKVHNWSQSIEPEFKKMIDGCPDYHCFNKEPKGPKDGYVSLEHSYVFFRHNEDKMGFFKRLDRYWDAIKVLSGRSKDSFKSNIPSDGIIDRITFLQYPIGYGKISKHYDSSKGQKLLLGNILTQIGEDYDYGENGFYLVGKNGKNIYIENNGVQKGDFVCVYPTLYHGVPVITKSGSSGGPDWSSDAGRWYLQCYSAESHEVKDREYTVAIKDKAGHGPVANYIGEISE